MREDHRNDYGMYRDRCRQAYLVFHDGHNTLQVAQHLKITEAQAEKRITIGRSLFTGLPNPYEWTGVRSWSW